MNASDRLDAGLRRRRESGEPWLVPYLTVADPSPEWTVEIALAALSAGADAIELGIPTGGASPKGSEVRRSFDRALAQVPTLTAVWQVCRRLRAAAPDVPILGLAFTRSIEEIGWSQFLIELRAAGIDGLVISDLSEPKLLDLVADHGVSPVPLIRQGAAPALACQLEAKARHLAYRTLAPQTGTPLNLAACTAAARAMRAAANKPYLLGFGLRDPIELRALAPYADGFVVGSELLRRLQQVPEGRYRAAVSGWIGEWKSACR